MQVIQTAEQVEEQFYDSMYVVSHSKKTVKTYKTAINHLRKFLSIQYNIDEIELVNKIKNDELDVYTVFAQLVVYFDKNNLRSRGLRSYLSGIKGYLRQYGIKINSDDFKQVVKIPKIIRTKEIAITKEMILRTLRNANSKLQTAILVSVSSGIRIGELVQLNLSDIEFESNPVKITIRASTSKTREGRETFITSEASKALQDYLSRYFGWSKTGDNSHLQETFIFGSITKRGRKSKESGFNVESAKLALQKSLRNHIGEISDLDVENENGYKAIHFHAFRKYFRTTVGNVCGRDYAEALIGHHFYMDTYYQLPEEKKQQMYLDAEPHLTITDTKLIENNFKSLSAKHNALEAKVDELMQYLRTNSIQVPENLIQ